MQLMKFFVDTHDHRSQTFPAGISRDDFAQFFAKYERFAREEGVVVLRVHVGFEEGRAFCFNMAPSAEHVKRAHDKAGLPFDSITEVSTATPGDLFFHPQL
jgi:hypothetical protein